MFSIPNLLNKTDLTAQLAYAISWRDTQQQPNSIQENLHREAV